MKKVKEVKSEEVKVDADAIAADEASTVEVLIGEDGIPVTHDAAGNLIMGISGKAFKGAEEKIAGRKAFCNYKVECCAVRKAIFLAKAAAQDALAADYLAEALLDVDAMTDAEKKLAKIAKMEKQIAAMKASMEAGE